MRFGLRPRLEHILLMVTFIVLATTGLAQKFYTADVSQWIIMRLGGIDITAGLVHRGFALILVVGMVYHLGLVFYSVFIKHNRRAMLPTLQDTRNTVNQLRRGLGLKAPRPQFGRYDYRQKFEYIGLLCGSMILIVTGFILAFPVAVTRLVSGRIVAAAVEFHGNEATLAVLVIIIWHLYDVVLDQGIFPADTSIFTGRISRRRMMAEHGLEYMEVQNQTREGVALASSTDPNQTPV